MGMVKRVALLCIALVAIVLVWCGRLDRAAVPLRRAAPLVVRGGSDSQPTPTLMLAAETRAVVKPSSVQGRASEITFPPPREAVTAFVPATGWRDVGNQTPAAALETYLWAATHGEVERLADVVTIGDWKGRDDFFSQLSDEDRKKFGTPNQVAAVITAGDMQDIVAIPSVSFVEPSGEVVRAVLTGANGQEIVAIWWIQKKADGYRIEVSGLAVRNCWRATADGRFYSPRDGKRSLHGRRIFASQTFLCALPLLPHGPRTT